MATAPTKPNQNAPRGFLVRLLDLVEWLGNKLPDPAVLFLIGLILTWALSAWMSRMEFTEVKPGETEPVQVVNMLTLDNFATFLTTMVDEFAKFPPLGIVLVALLGVAVAEHSGFINACLKSMLDIAPVKLLTPILILVAIISHTAADAGYVLVIPIGGVMFYAAGRHPLAGIAAAFAGVSGGFSANFIVSGLDPLLSSLTQTGVDLVNKDYIVNPLCNILFTAVSSIFIITVGWFITDRIIEPKLAGTEIDGDPDEIPKFDQLTSRDRAGMWLGLISILVSSGLLAWWAIPADSALRDEFGSLTAYKNSISDFGIEFDAGDYTLVKSAEKMKRCEVCGKASSDGATTCTHCKTSKDKEAETDADSAEDLPEQSESDEQKDEDSFVDLTEEESIQPGDRLLKVVEQLPDGSESVWEFASAKDFALFTVQRPKLRPAQFVFERPAKEGDAEPTEFAIDLVPTKADRPGAPLMKMIVPLIFLIFVVPGLVHGYVAGKYRSHRDVIKGMSKTMETMGYYLVLVFFAALFIAAFKNSGIGDLLALKGANFIKESGAPPWLTVVCMILLAAAVNLLIGSASAKWAMLAPIFVPMLMYAGISPELTQAAYRIGDSTTNIITPMMPYFPLVVVFCQRYVRESGIGTVAAMMLPYSIGFLVTWTILLLVYWSIGLPLGIPTDVGYEYVVQTSVR